MTYAIFGNVKGVYYIQQTDYEIISTSPQFVEKTIPDLVRFANFVAQSLNLPDPCLGFANLENTGNKTLGLFITGTEKVIPCVLLDPVTHDKYTDEKKNVQELKHTVAHELAHAFQFINLDHQTIYSNVKSIEHEAEMFAYKFCSNEIEKAIEYLKKSISNYKNKSLDRSWF